MNQTKTSEFEEKIREKNLGYQPRRKKLVSNGKYQILLFLGSLKITFTGLSTRGKKDQLAE